MKLHICMTVVYPLPRIVEIICTDTPNFKCDHYSHFFTYLFILRKVNYNEKLLPKHKIFI